MRWRDLFFRLGALGSIALLATSLLACPADKTSKNRVLVIGRPGDALTLDPAAITDNESVQVGSQIFDTLVRYRPHSMRVEPSLATRWTVSPDETVWTFELRRGVRFHDGTLFDADAVVFSFERQRDHGHPFHFQRFTYWENTFRNIVEVRKVGRFQVRIRINRPFAPFLANLAMFPVSIVSPTAMKRLGRAFARHPVGTGPYRFVRWDKKKEIVLVKNDGFWGGKPQVPRLVYRVMPGAGQRLVSLQSGTIDVAYGIAPEDRQIVSLHPDLALERISGNNVAYLAMHNGRPPFDDVRVRRAINYAINKDAIVKLVYQGLARPARGPIPPSMWSHERNIKTYGYDPARARALLKRAGFEPTRPLRFYVMTTPRPYMPSPVLVAKIIARNLSAIGVDVEIVKHPHGEHLRAIRRGDHDLCLLGWVGDNGDPDNFLYVLLDSDNARVGTAQNVAFFTNKRLHALLSRAQVVRDRRQRDRYYRQAQRLVARQAPWVPLAHTEVVVAHRLGLQHLEIHPSNVILYRAVRF